MNTSDWIAAASLGVAFAALGVSWFGIRRANKTTSAATMVTLNEGYRQAWVRFFASEDKSWELAELMNLVEIGCAAYIEESITGNSREILLDYLSRVLETLKNNEYSNTEIEKKLIQSDDTFIFVKLFLNSNPKLSVIIPPRWYELAASAKRKRRWAFPHRWLFGWGR